MMVARVRTLYSFKDLDNTSFGLPLPRQGRQLLFWLLHMIKVYDYNLYLLFDTYQTSFGFHKFYNKECILPNDGLTYYALGNLGKIGSNDLPEHILEHYSGRFDCSNIDRIIVRIDQDWYIHSIYASEHYKPHATYRIHKSLLF
ncbi:hypothetical protein HF521_009027 [Silurus meridionalis]|uniref:Uncharacterized protein n=1 Tax=Silurus meridionalis TaxID=175797 RepID=A0A8T0BTH3_SILME|nr:hypothetical protein HF521_009027 [Silurus meridionalis]